MESFRAILMMLLSDYFIIFMPPEIIFIIISMPPPFFAAISPMPFSLNAIIFVTPLLDAIAIALYDYCRRFIDTFHFISPLMPFSFLRLFLFISPPFHYS
jgi:hypothetical protein